ncbi:MAG: hypothetical protein AAGE88_22585 [Actinomycetota bacterium]
MSKAVGWLAIGFVAYFILRFPNESAPVVKAFFQAVWVAFQQFVVFLDGAVPEPEPAPPPG